MYTFPILIKKIRDEAGLTQPEFARILEVSPALIAMVETGQKNVSKKLVTKLAEKLFVHPSSITPFIFITEDFNINKTTGVEKKLIELGEKMQTLLIKNKSRKLKNAKQTLS